MIKVAIMLKDKKDGMQVADDIKKFGAERAEVVKVKVFDNVIDYFAAYKSKFDVAILDTQLKDISGIQVAQVIRNSGDEMPIIFISASREDAIYGFTYNAVGYILKPVNSKDLYNAWSSALDVLHRHTDDQLHLLTGGVIAAVEIKQIYKVTVCGHYLHYFTDTNEYVVRGVMKQCQQKLSDYGFVRCNHSTLINLKYVTKLDKEKVIVHGETIDVSHSKFKNLLSEYKS
jgi:DNA-binding LytR/AlgR family response regulator